MAFTQSSGTQLTVIHQCERLLGADAVVAGDAIQAPLSHQLSRAIAPSAHDSHLPACIVFPKTQAELAEIVTCAYKNRWSMLPIGSGSKLHWGGLVKPIQLAISTSRLSQIIDHAVGDLTITAEAGIPYGAIAHTLTQTRQQLGIDPSYPDQATLGGIVATGDSGSLRQRYGSVRDMLIGLSFIRADGTGAKAGGRVVKNVAGYDLMKLMTGAYGTLGIISQLTFRVYPMAEASKTVVLAGDADSIQALAAAIFASSLTPHRFDLLSPSLMTRLDFSPSMGLMMQFESIAVSVEQQVQQLAGMAESPLVQIVGVFEGNSEATLWRRLREQMDTNPTEIPITCKIGVLPDQAVATMASLSTVLPTDTHPEAIAQFHLGSGLGRICFDGEAIAPQSILPLRRWCEAHGGFLTLLEAPSSWKQQVDVWGYIGNGLSVMEALKHQFDPHHLLSPSRFVGSI